jgi:hypothetical protein
MRLGIDASNLRIGGGITHLVELLRAARPREHGIHRVVVWTYGQLASQLPARSWLTVVPEPLLDRPLPLRLGIYAGSFRPFVTMSRNMLPFERRERQRYGFSWMGLRLALLRVAQSRGFRQASGVIFLSRYACSTVMNQVPGIKGVAIIPKGGPSSGPRGPKALTDCSFATCPLAVCFTWMFTNIRSRHSPGGVITTKECRGKIDLVRPAYFRFCRLCRRADRTREISSIMRGRAVC